jgi:hypothetical protein
MIEYRTEEPDYFHYQAWLGGLGKDDWILRAIGTDDVHVFSRDSSQARDGIRHRPSPDKEAARRIWALIQRDALENGIPQSEWKWQTFAEFWQMYAADQESRG